MNYSTTFESNIPTKGFHNPFLQSKLKVRSDHQFGPLLPGHSLPDTEPKTLSWRTETRIITPEAKEQISLGVIPDLSETCIHLYRTIADNRGASSAVKFIGIMGKMKAPKLKELMKFRDNPKTNHVLVDNHLLKVVLIHWKPGKVSSIHGHPKGGCIFKVLKGNVHEMRYTADESKSLLASSSYRAGSMAYIDDQMAYHSVSNPFGVSAFTLHVYTYGR